MSDLVPPLFRRCGGTFPQGKVRERPRREAAFPYGEGKETPPPGGSLPLRGRWTGRSPGRMRGNNRKVKSRPR